eukprot:COSAG02_NODE_3587_length_6520_cov_6.037060_1_plen_98_part_00
MERLEQEAEQETEQAPMMPWMHSYTTTTHMVILNRNGTDEQRKGKAHDASVASLPMCPVGQSSQLELVICAVSDRLLQCSYVEGQEIPVSTSVTDIL